MFIEYLSVICRLMGVNGRGSFIVVKEALQWLRKAEEARGESLDWTPKIVVVSPPIYKRFMRGKIAYAMSKVGLSTVNTSHADAVEDPHDCNDDIPPN